MEENIMNKHVQEWIDSLKGANKKSLARYHNVDIDNLTDKQKLQLFLNDFNYNPVEIQRNDELDIEYASFNFFIGLQLVELFEWKKVSDMKSLDEPDTYIVIAGYIVKKINADEWPEIVRTKL